MPDVIPRSTVDTRPDGREWIREVKLNGCQIQMQSREEPC